MEETPVQPHTRKDTGCNLVPDQKTSMSGEYFPLARRSLVILRRRHCSPMACSHCGFRGPPGLRRSPRLAAARHCFSASARNSRNGLGPLWRAFFAAGSRPIATMARFRDTAKWWAGKFPVTCMCRIWASRRKHRAAIAAKSGGRPPRSARRLRACRHLSTRGAPPIPVPKKNSEHVRNLDPLRPAPDFPNPIQTQAPDSRHHRFGLRQGLDVDDGHLHVRPELLQEDSCFRAFRYELIRGHGPGRVAA